MEDVERDGGLAHGHHHSGSQSSSHHLVPYYQPAKPLLLGQTEEHVCLCSLKIWFLINSFVVFIVETYISSFPQQPCLKDG